MELLLQFGVGVKQHLRISDLFFESFDELRLALDLLSFLSDLNPEAL